VLLPVLDDLLRPRGTDAFDGAQFLDIGAVDVDLVMCFFCSLWLRHSVHLLGNTTQQRSLGGDRSAGN